MKRKKASGAGSTGGSRPAKKAKRTSSRRGTGDGPHRGSVRGVRNQDEQGEDASESGVRLQKFLATAGVDSRRNCEEYIRTGRVTIDGRVAEDPAERVDGEQQVVCVDGERLKTPKLRYFLINKPRGVLCTNRDPQGRPRAIDLVPARGQRLFTVGRLDESTEGLLLITNDGDLAEKLAHPRYEVVRRYRVQVAGIPKAETLTELREGMHFADGFFRFRGIRVINRRGKSATLELELREGKNREIRRLLARVGHKVLSLTRIAFGPLKLGILHKGRYRELSRREVDDLTKFVNGELKSESSDKRRPRKKAAGKSRTTAGRGKQKKVSARKKGKPASTRTDVGKGRSRKRNG